MKAISQTYKDNIKQLGKEITYEITYDNTTLGDEDILNANLHYDGGMLKSVMKQLDIELYNDLAIGTELNYKFGVKVDDTNYEMVDYGKFIVYSSEKLEDSNTYKLVCYDKMLYAMKDYESIGVEYPITIRDYITALSETLGLTFSNEDDDFTNYDKTIEKELYIDNEGNNIGYTYRDVLDELAQATASTICINDNDELEIRYITNANEEKTSISGTSFNMTAHDSNVDIDLLGNTTQNTTTGKNKCPNNLTNGTTSGITYTKNSDGSIKITGTASARVEPDLYNNSSNPIVFSAGTYKNTSSRMIILYAGGYNVLYANSTLTLSESKSVTRIYFRIENGESNLNETYYPQIIVNGQSESYEPYTGGIASPNPNYPQNIETTTGRNTIEVVGKNLIDVSQINDITTQGITITTQNQQIILSGTPTRAWGSTARTKLNIPLKAGKTYHFSANANIDVRMWLYEDLTTGTIANNIGNNDTFTPTKDLYYFSFVYEHLTLGTPYNETITLQVEKGTGTSYEPYIGNSYEVNLGLIELCKIGTYQDRLFKASGKNLANDENIKLNYTLGTSGELISNNARTTLFQNEIKPSTTYNSSVSTNYLIGNLFFYDSNKTYLSQQTSSWGTTKTFTTPNNAYYISFATKRSDDGTMTQSDLNALHIQLEEGSSSSSYEPYGNYWYKYKAIGKYTFTGGASEVWSYKGTTGSRSVFQWSAALPDKLNTSANLPILCNNFSQCTISQTDNYAVDEGIANGIYNGYAIKIITKQASDLATFKTWLANHTTYVYYQLATPTYTKIENDELIGQLEHIRLINGYNNVISSSPITLNYVSGIDTIDEEYLKDINVNFGEEVKPINTITFKRSGDTDVISLSYPENLEDDKKNEIAISENQILNYDNRDEYLKGILDRLYGLTYCLNDYTSTGITYYDLCDRYNVSITKTDDEGNVIETNYYSCIMFNDEINVNQGLQEIVHTDRAEESITDYNTTSKTDRLKTRTDLIVDKQNGEILAVTGVLDIQEDGTSKVINGIQTTQNKDRLRIEAIVTKEGEGEDEVYTGVRTGDEHKTFTFDTNGLTIESLNNAYKNIQDETGNYYYDSDTMIGKYTKDGSVQKNMALFGKYYYGVDENVNVKTFNKDNAMFVSQLYEDGNGETGFGHFYNGD